MAGCLHVDGSHAIIRSGRVAVAQGAAANTSAASPRLFARPRHRRRLRRRKSYCRKRRRSPRTICRSLLVFRRKRANIFLPFKESDLDHIEKASQIAEIRAANANASHLAPIAEVQPDDLSLAGWGVIFASNTPAAQKQAIKDALKPLLDLRKSEAGDLFKIFDDETGYQPGLAAEKWLTARGSALNVVDPTQGVPYYLLVVGSAAEIPFEFQYDLDTYFAVGRIAFESPQEYAQYAQNLVNFEKSAGQQKTIAIFNTRNDGDRATALLHDQIALKLAQGGENLKPLGVPQGYRVTTRLADTASKSELLNILRGQTDAGTPAILFTGSHGVSFSSADPQQRFKQGAILTQDWAGPRKLHHVRHIPYSRRDSRNSVAERAPAFLLRLLQRGMSEVRHVLVWREQSTRADR